MVWILLGILLTIPALFVVLWLVLALAWLIATPFTWLIEKLPIKYRRIGLLVASRVWAGTRLVGSKSWAAIRFVGRKVRDVWDIVQGLINTWFLERRAGAKAPIGSDR